MAQFSPLHTTYLNLCRVGETDRCVCGINPPPPHPSTSLPSLHPIPPGQHFEALRRQDDYSILLYNHALLIVGVCVCVRQSDIFMHPLNVALR